MCDVRCCLYVVRVCWTGRHLQVPANPRVLRHRSRALGSSWMLRKWFYEGVGVHVGVCMCTGLPLLYVRARTRFH